MVRWLATPLLVVGLGVDGVQLWTHVQSQRAILFPTEFQVQTPNVLGLTVVAAKAKILAAGLTLGRITEVEVSTDTPRGIVLGQRPAHGQRVVLGFEMRLYVSKGPDAGIGAAGSETVRR